MAIFKDPFDAKALLGRRCSCGGAHSRGRPRPADGRSGGRGRALEPGGRCCRPARGLPGRRHPPPVPEDGRRGHGDGRDLLGACRSGLRARPSPRAARPRRRTSRSAFIPITCATPIIMAHPMGFYSKHGLNVEVVKTAGWAVIRDKALAKEYDAAHMLSPMPLAISLGVGSAATPWTMPAIENINGQAITLAVKHKDKREVRRRSRRVRLPDRPFRLRQDHDPERAGRPRQPERGRGDRRQPRDRRAEPRSRGDLPGPCAAAVADGDGQHRLRRLLALAVVGSREGAGACEEVHRSGRAEGRRGQEARRSSPAA